MERPELKLDRLRPVAKDPGSRPRVLVLVATEEEFDWHGNFDREAVATTAISGLEVGQAVFDEFEIRPTYAIDYPVAEQCGDVFRQLCLEDRARIGAHLHPWVNPPLTEELTNQHSFPCYLPPELERAKLVQLTASIERNVGVRPRVYQAGRFGIGEHSLASLAELGYRVDASLAPPFDYGYLGGPDHSAFGPGPVWGGPDENLLLLPVTGAFVGRLGRHNRGVYRMAARPQLRNMRLTGVLARTRLIERIRLSPEGFEVGDMIRLVKFLYGRGERVFTFYFHSPSLVPGHTEFVHTAQDQRIFLDRFRGFFDFFLGEFGGVASTHEDLWAELSGAGEPGDAASER